MIHGALCKIRRTEDQFIILMVWGGRLIFVVHLHLEAWLRSPVEMCFLDAAHLRFF